MASSQLAMSYKGRNLTRGWENRSWQKRQTNRLDRRKAKIQIKNLVDPYGKDQHRVKYWAF